MTAIQMSFPTIEAPCKKCSRCGHIKPLADFHKADGTLDGHYSFCRTCKNNGVPDPMRKERNELLEQGLRRCIECLEIKPLEHFYETPFVSDGYLAICKPCLRERQYPGATRRIEKRNKWRAERKLLKEDGRRRCKKCKKIYPIEDFYIDVNGVRENTCKHCIRERQSPGAVQRKKRRKKLREQGLKKCNGCKEIKPHSEFYVDSQRHGHYLPRCKACCAEAGREWRQKNHGKGTMSWRRRRAREFNAKGKHTHEDIERLYKKQRALCPYRTLNPRCKKSLENGYHVDHIIPISRNGHDDPSNLQLLCPHCNISKNNKTHKEYVVWLEKTYG